MTGLMPSRTPKAIVQEGPAAEARLVDLGLDFAGMAKALELALGDRLACTDFDPPMFAGQTRSARLVRYLREEYVERGWSPQDAQNYSLLLSPGSDVAIQVATGNEAAGDGTNPFPRLAHPKGEMTEKSVKRNAQQLNLFTGDADELGEGPTTWILLVNERNGALHAELSWPDSFYNGQIESWIERIILPNVPYGGNSHSADRTAPPPVSHTPSVRRRPSA